MIETNYSIVSSTQYDEIIRYLKADDKSSFQRKLKRKVKANNYSLINFPCLGIHYFLCVPVSGAEKVNVFDNFIIIFLMHISVDKGLKDTKLKEAKARRSYVKCRQHQIQLDSIFKDTATTISWYSFYRPRKDERLSRPWSHPYNKHTYSTLKNIFKKEETGCQCGL